MTSHRSIALATALLLSGCTMAPHYTRPAMPVPQTTPQGPSYQTAAPRPVEAQALEWEHIFTDDRLRVVIRQALKGNRDLRIAMANVARVRAQYRVQNADLFPTVGLSGSATYERVPPGLGGFVGTATSSASRYDVYQGGVGVSAWEVDLFGRVRSLTQAAQEQFFASQANRDAAQVALVAQVATSWLTLATDQDRLRIARDTADAFAQTLTITQGRAEQGVASDLDVAQARSSYDQARSDVASTTTAVAQDRNMLDLLAGGSVSSDLLPTGLGTMQATLDTLPANLPSSVLLGRPDVIGAEHQLLAANANIGAARAAFFPQISLTATLGTLSLGLSNLLGNGSSFWSVAPTASLPIFDFGKNRGNLHDAQATRDAMVATYEKTLQTAFREVADALARRGTITEQLDAQISGEQAAATALRIARQRYAEGIDPFLNTLDAQRSYYTAQRTLVSTRLEKQANAVALYKALGGGAR